MVDDLNICTICGAAIPDGVRTLHEDGGPLCVDCARRLWPEETSIAELAQRLFGPDSPDGDQENK